MAVRALPALLLILFLPHLLEASEADRMTYDMRHYDEVHRQHFDRFEAASSETDTSHIPGLEGGWRKHSVDPPPHYSMFWRLIESWRLDVEHDRAWAVSRTAERFDLSTTEAATYLDALIAASAKVGAAMDKAVYSILCPVHTAQPRGEEIGVVLNSLTGVRWSVQKAHLHAFNAQHPAQKDLLIAELTERASKGISLSTNHTRRDPGELEQHLTLICENRP